MTIPAKVRERLATGVKRFQPVLRTAKDKDINESDTVAIITDMLSEVFGYDKYAEITSELAIKKTFCDLAIKLDNEVRLLIEVKAAGLDLKEQHIRQAVNYGSNSGIDWVVLTNGVFWKIYKVIFGKPITVDLVYEIPFLEISARKDEDLEMLYMLSKESINKNNRAALEAYHAQRQLLNKYMIGQILLSDQIIDSVRKAMKSMASDTKVTNEEIHKIIYDEVIKRDVLDDDRAADARKCVAKALSAPKPKKAVKEPKMEP